MKFLSLLAAVVFAACVSAAPQQRPLPPCGCSGPSTCTTCPTGECLCASCVVASPAPSTYGEARARAVAEGKPLVVFVGQPALDIPGAVCCSTFNLEGAAWPSVVIGLPAYGDSKRVADLPGRASLDRILPILSPPPQAAVPFVPPAAYRPAAAVCKS